MTDLQQALAIGGGIFIVMMASQYGYRDYTWHKWAMPLISVAIFGYFYLKDAPSDGVDFVVYAVALALGVVFGFAATATTTVEKNPAKGGAIYTRAGVGFASVWLLALAARVVFIVLAEHNQAFRNALGTFMYNHQIVEETIPPFFCLWAVVMVATRVGLIALKAASLRSQTGVAIGATDLEPVRSIA
ncbi:hypothetical protein ABIB25_002463 [Nakamurella sp. UYEF19]|uniref:hypothetical protein n=1 Tax=Nakamurella sp. UYEF19 TaxID=1756392 RepID=UPI003392B560